MNILFVDDQWCKPDQQDNIIAEYGPLRRREPPYTFHFETAEDSKGGYAVSPVLEKISKIGSVGAVVLDIMFGDSGDRLGLKILAAIRQKYPTLPVFMMTSLEGDIDVVEKAMELGANEYLIKKPILDELETALRLYTQPSAIESAYAIWGNSSAIRHVRALIAKVALGGAASVLVTGESGTGKELVARAVHRQGPRRRGPFVSTNCAYKEHSLLEAELFGHEKGAFTGADRKYVGLIERADRGVLFLDEIGSIPLELQGRLLRVLETKEYERLGGEEVLRSDFQLICATNEDPERLMQEGLMRRDFYYRINQFLIHVPPLREHVEDIPILTQYFFQQYKTGGGASYRAQSLPKKLVERLVDYPWPGNARELRNAIERAIIHARTPEIRAEDLSAEIISQASAKPKAGRAGADIASFSLPEDVTDWPRWRLKAELLMAIEVKRHIQQYKKSYWKAEFMRLMYPNCKAQSAKGFNDLIGRLTRGPWGDPNLEKNEELGPLLKKIKR